MKTLIIFALLMFPTWSLKTQTEVVVEPGQEPAHIPIEGMKAGDAVRLEIDSVSPVVAGIVKITGRGSYSYEAVCFRERVTHSVAECNLPSDNSAIVISDARTIRIRQNRVTATLYAQE